MIAATLVISTLTLLLVLAIIVGIGVALVKFKAAKAKVIEALKVAAAVQAMQQATRPVVAADPEAA